MSQVGRSGANHNGHCGIPLGPPLGSLYTAG